MASKSIDIEGISYHTLYETPSTTSTSTPPPLVVLSHALMSNHHMWDATASTLLSSGFSVLRYDHIGHNQTPAPKNHNSSLEHPAYHFDDFTRHIRSLVLAATGSSQVYCLIGCSMGGVLALRYAMLYPNEIDRVISCDSPGMTSLKSAIPLWEERIELLKKDVENGTDELCRKTVERWIPGNLERDQSCRDLTLPIVKTCSLDGYRICADAIRTYDYHAELGNIKDVKCMILVGSEDSAVGPKRVLEEVAESIPGAEYVWLEGAGHLPPLHLPDEFGEVMLNFLKK